MAVRQSLRNREELHNITDIEPIIINFTDRFPHNHPSPFYSTSNRTYSQGGGAVLEIEADTCASRHCRTLSSSLTVWRHSRQTTEACVADILRSCSTSAFFMSQDWFLRFVYMLHVKFLIDCFVGHQ